MKLMILVLNKIMINPVIALDGFTYERVAIVEVMFHSSDSYLHYLTLCVEFFIALVDCGKQCQSDN